MPLVLADTFVGQDSFFGRKSCGFHLNDASGRSGNGGKNVSVQGVFPSEKQVCRVPESSGIARIGNTSAGLARPDDLDAWPSTGSFRGKHKQPPNTMKTNPITFAILLAVAVGNLTTIVNAEDKKSSLNAADEKFVKQAGVSGTAEVKIATLGTQKAERADVKEFATMLVADHTKANEELAALAKSKRVEFSAVIDPKSAGVFEDLEKERGADFDKAFLSHLKSAHKSTVASFEEASKDATDAEVKAWAGKMLPTLKAHLDKVVELQGK